MATDHSNLRAKDVLRAWIIFFVVAGLLRWREWASTPKKLVDIAISGTVFTIVMLGLNWWRARRPQPD